MDRRLLYQPMKPSGSLRRSMLAPEPCQLVRRYSSKIVAAAANDPILDVACGSGRNAIHLWQLGCTVICVDQNLEDFQSQRRSLFPDCSTSADKRLILKRTDLVADPWPFGRGTAGGIVNIHFLIPGLLPSFESSLRSGGYLLLETVPGHGNNYLQLPKSGDLRAALARGFDLEYYKESKVGPKGYDAVAVQLLARRR